MHSHEFLQHLELEHLIDSNGDVPKDKNHLIASNESKAIGVVKSMLGMELEVRGKKFTLTNLELYYGGIGDKAHDWYRLAFPFKCPKKSKTNRELSKTQLHLGPKFYFNQKGNGGRKRADIVLGKEGVAVSVLIRNVADENGNLVGSIDGNTQLILGPMGVLDEDHGKLLINHESVRLLPRLKHFEGNQINENLRYISGKGYVGFEDINDTSKWNFSISHLFNS